jgi:hypothetical protein
MKEATGLWFYYSSLHRTIPSFADAMLHDEESAVSKLCAAQAQKHGRFFFFFWLKDSDQKSPFD